MPHRQQQELETYLTTGWSLTLLESHYLQSCGSEPLLLTHDTDPYLSPRRKGVLDAPLLPLRRLPATAGPRC